MPSPIQRTMTFLSCTPNQAAVPVLFAALESRHQPIRVGAVRAMAERRSREGHTHILQRFPKLGEDEQHALAAALQHSTHHMKPALHDAILGSHLELCESACHVALLGRVYELLPTLVTAAALGVGILVFAGVFTQSVEETANTKALVSVGSDVSVPLGAYPDTPPKEPFPVTATAVLVATLAVYLNALAG